MHTNIKQRDIYHKQRQELIVIYKYFWNMLLLSINHNHPIQYMVEALPNLRIKGLQVIPWRRLVFLGNPISIQF